MSNQSYRVGFLLVPNFSVISFASASEPLRMANMVAGRRLYEILLISADGRPVAASSGVQMVADCVMAQAPRLDLVLVCGPNPIPPQPERAMLDWLRGQARDGVPLGGVCTGSYLLARAGLLDGYRCTIHWEDMDRLRESFPHIVVSSRLFEVDRDRYTCSGGTAPMDMMFHLIAQHWKDRKLVAAVSELLVCERIRQGEDRQRIPLRQQLGTAQPKLSEAVALMEANLEEPLPLEEIARHLDISFRQLERLFHDYLHTTPARYYMELRLNKARQLLLTTPLAITQVALACGFASVSHFTKNYSRQFGMPPREQRRRAGMLVGG
ncbi:MAG TPA: GlxA family transcriptional regulator [Candidatus Competibacteraceae bacterium]|nr:GlxA family transcriptional regulator [Candidatus Competibacteraceae bacterium]